MLDPGHGGTKKVGGSSPNNAISKSGVKEKKLTLDFCLILRDELTKQAERSNEPVHDGISIHLLNGLVDLGYGSCGPFRSDHRCCRIWVGFLSGRTPATEAIAPTRPEAAVSPQTGTGVVGSI